MSDGAVDTVEALIRWQHPDHGAIPPSEFIGVAEQTDLIGPITELVLRAATVGMITASAGDVKLAVNVSARSLQDPNVRRRGVRRARQSRASRRADSSSRSPSGRS